MFNAGNRIVNNWIYSIPEGFVLIDTGYENGFANLKKRLDLLKIDIKDIHYIFLTHGHDDHAGFLNEFLSELPDVQVIMSHRALEALYRGQNAFTGGCTSRLALFFCHLMKLFGKGAHRFPPLNPKFERRCVLVSDDNRKEIEAKLGGIIVDTPGHTADSIALLLNDGALFCGDASMNGLPSMNRITIWAEDKDLLFQSWQTIIALKPTKIYPGHGKPFDYSELEQNKCNVRKMKLYPLSSAE
ncbi:MBL fold metallo-hydrolase [Desulfitobacterium chlororespirans]|uniref:Glyoxylase, beta-lactamase superfamily II n=1 Tax=Desulfitobacterium chlororespirans DSM 11544 TaxID=1121395 RepID=A0A1M7TIG9_9FIRM|nr:MBL fold metallo-hydrolase [Desulfitobacterium chlororespirans]SHN70554.1 Glyoxylase, beta-lactamase superfamily II [Desulfitobacterium chlororespirans DSM 11544]